MLNKFPFRVTLLLFLVLFFTAWNFLRLWTALEWQSSLSEFNVLPVARVIALSGGLWSLVGSILIWGIWQQKPWATKLLFGTVAGYTVWYWGERLLWQMPRPNWPFTVILNLVFVFFILFVAKSPTREAYERKS